MLVYLAIHSLIAVTARHPTIVGLGTPFTCAFRQTIAMKTLSSYYKAQASEPTDACSPKEEPNRISSSLDIENDTKACMWDTLLEFDRCIALMAKDHKSIAEGGRYRQKVIKSEKKLH